MKIPVYIDIESVPTDNEAIRHKAIEKVTPPSNYKKPETIDAWWKEQGEKAKNDAIHALGLNGGSGKIVCLGLAFGDEEPATFVGEESEILRTMNAVIKDKLNAIMHEPLFIGHNISGFDLRYIWQRLVVLGIKPAFGLPYNEAVWSGKYYDTMTEWAGARGRVSLEDLCMYLGVDLPKGGMNGADVWDYYKQGRIYEIREYCKGDVEAVRACHKRMTFQV